MTINYDELMASRVSDIPVSYDEKNALLYALGIGFGRNPLDLNELPFVYEGHGVFERHGPHTVPTLASMLIPDTVIAASGCNLGQILHRAQTLELYRAMPVSAELLLDQRVTGIFDHGAGAGAVIDIESELRLARDDTVVCTLGSRLIARADGGFGGPPPIGRPRHKLPDREPDMICETRTRPDQALLFRLSGDFNPLHADPVVAGNAGFEAPILHGRCTYGIACHAVLKTVCDYDFTLIRSFDVRFGAPVYPGDIITTEIWQDRNIVSFRCRVSARDVMVINNGKCVLAA